MTGGGKNKNKRSINHFYFYFVLLKVRVGSPVKHFIKNKRPYNSIFTMSRLVRTPVVIYVESNAIKGKSVRELRCLV